MSVVYIVSGNVCWVQCCHTKWYKNRLSHYGFVLQYSMLFNWLILYDIRHFVWCWWFCMIYWYKNMWCYPHFVLQYAFWLIALILYHSPAFIQNLTIASEHRFLVSSYKTVWNSGVTFWVSLTPSYKLVKNFGIILEVSFSMIDLVTRGFRVVVVVPRIVISRNPEVLSEPENSASISD